MRMFLFVSFVFFVLTQQSWSRPEYVAKTGIINCNVCHTSPMGGTSRTLDGKMFGSHEYKLNPFPKNDMFSGDVRFEGLYQKGPTSETRGILFMTADLSFLVPLTENEAGKPEDLFLFALGLSPMEKQNYFNREAIYIHRFVQPGETSWFSTLSIGRFQLPFGLRTDEHRTFTRVQTRTTSFDYDAGLALTADPSNRVHWDLTLSGGQPYTMGGETPVINDSPYGIVANIRWNPYFFPGFLGASHYVLNSSTLSQPSVATSLYFSSSLETLLSARLNWQLEYVESAGFNAKEINPNLEKTFFPSSEAAWFDSVKKSRSMGWYSLLNYEVSSHLFLLWKFEQYVPDKEFVGDLFTRNGVGLKYFLTSHSDLNFRIEQSLSTRPGVTETSNSKAAQNAGFLLFHIWF